MRARFNGTYIEILNGTEVVESFQASPISGAKGLCAALMMQGYVGTIGAVWVASGRNKFIDVLKVGS